jgi:hypothetical protein
MTNKGFEALIETVNINKNNFQWTTNFNFSTLTNEVTGIGELERIITGRAPTSEFATIIREGIPVNSYFGYRITGIYQDADQIANSAQPNSKPGFPIFQDVNGDGTINPDDRVVLGDPIPDFTFGLGNTFKYKAISLDVFINGKVGNEILNGTALAQAYPRTFRRNRSADQIADRWRPSNTDAKWPSGIETNRYGPGTVTSLFVEDASYLRIRTATLSYQLPTDKLDFIDSFNLSLTVNNLLTITNYSGLNPDANTYGNDNVVIDFASYPLSKSFTIGLNVTF